MTDWSFWLPRIVAGTLAGGVSGLMGVYIVGRRVPFLAVCVAHAALAGAVFAGLAGLSSGASLGPALVAAVAVALALGSYEETDARLDANLLVGVLFSLSMGLAFLGIGLHSLLGKPDYAVRGLLWGSLTYCGWPETGRMAAAGGLLTAFVVLFRKELRAILFSRLHAAAAGVPVGLVWTGFLVLSSTALTVNFQTVGGLMIYSLITNPALAAMQLARGHDRVAVLAVALGAASSLLGFFVSAWTDLPTGATIVIMSSLLVGAAMLIRLQRASGSATGLRRPTGAG
jgi:manganese/iron transport system permease protein